MYWEGEGRGRGKVGDTVEVPSRMDQENTIGGGGRGDVLMCLMLYPNYLCYPDTIGRDTAAFRGENGGKQPNL